MTRASITWNAKQISKMYENGSLRFDNAIQRGEVWDNKRKSLLIDSMLRDFPVPPMYTIQTGDEIETPRGMVKVYDCLDGKQRCTAINHFKNNKFVLSGLDTLLFGEDEIDINGLTYEELPEELKDAFDSFSLNVYYITDSSEEEIVQMMDRLNNGKAMTGVEKSRIKAIDLEGIRELAFHNFFKDNLTPSAFNSYTNEDIVIKNYVQYTDPDDPSFDTKRTKEVYASHVFTEEEKKRFNGIFEKAWETLALIESDSPKAVHRKTLKKNNLLAILSLIELDISAEDLAERIEKFFTTEDKTLSIDPDYNEASRNGTNHASSVKLRNRILHDYVTSGYFQ